jgi:hypothetical protein
LAAVVASAQSTLKATFSAELVAKGWPRNGADQTIPQNLSTDSLAVGLATILLWLAIAASRFGDVRKAHGHIGNAPA